MLQYTADPLKITGCTALFACSLIQNILDRTAIAGIDLQLSSTLHERTPEAFKSESLNTGHNYQQI